MSVLSRIDWNSAHSAGKRRRATDANDRGESTDPNHHLGLIRVVAMRVAKQTGDDADLILSYAYEMFVRLMRIYDPSKARVSTFYLKYGPSHTARAFLSVERGRPRRSTTHRPETIRLDITPSMSELFVAKSIPERRELPSTHRLSARQYHVVRALANGCTLRQVGRSLGGLSQQRCEQIQSDAMDVMAGVPKLRKGK